MLPGFHGALLNSASPWASTKEQLTELYLCRWTGAVTVRTSLLGGWSHDDAINQSTFFDATMNVPVPERSPRANSSLNTYGYSPTPLAEYLTIIEEIVGANSATDVKPFIVSVTGTPQDIVECRRLIINHAAKTRIPLLMEINLSCPNIVNMPPPAYSSSSLQHYLFALQRDSLARDETCPIPVGIKTSPYTYHDQFTTVIDALTATTGGGLACPISFITVTNTLGNCLVMDEAEDGSWTPALRSASGSGIGGVGGSAIHALSLGNVRTLRTMLDQNDTLRQIDIIGVGGVADFLGVKRMRSAGASAVAIGTAFGRAGIDVFAKIAAEMKMAGSAPRSTH